MPLDINTGYNETFQSFADFAMQSVGAGKAKAIARVDDAGGIAGRTITAAKHDWVGIGVGRLHSLKVANNTTRDIFRDAIINMFGSVDKIPPIVSEAMKLEDYDKGKPLTARRILAVKNAIDESRVAKQRAEAEAKQAEFDKSISVFKDADTEKAALGKGYAKGELPTIAKAVNLLVQTTDCSEADALEQVTTPGSNANRLMKYGGRFLQSAENFQNGMRLLDTFSKWFDKTTAALQEIANTEDPDLKYTDDMPKTLLNGSTSVFSDRCKGPVERFVFEEIANNPDANLAETDPEKIFGMENNQAMGAIGRNFQSSRSQTFAQIPPGKRATFFKALNTICPIYASTAREALVPPPSRNSLLRRQLDAPVARILKNLDQIVVLETRGKLTAANLVKLCFPEIPKPGRNPVDDVIQLVRRWETDMDVRGGTNKYDPNYIDGMNEAMTSTGCSIKDALSIAKGEKQLPNVPYYSTATLEFHQMDGTPNAARSQLEDDLIRPDNYKNMESGERLLKNGLGFTFHLPGGESLVANGTEEGTATIPKVIEKLEALCGKVHPEQASSLMMMTSQSGLGILKGGLKPYGIASSEHVAVDFTISRNPETGDISIRYSSPRELPFAFEWTATVKPDGSVSTTPMRFTDAETLQREITAAATAIKDVLKGRIRKTAEIANAVDKLLDGAKADRDLVALLQAKRCAVAKNILLDANGKLRSEEEISRRLEALRGNVNELRAVAGGNGRIFQTGLKQLELFNGKALPAGMLTKIAELSMKADASALKGLSAQSSAVDIFKAMCALDRIVIDVDNELNVLKTLDADAQGTTNLNSMVAGFVFATMDEPSIIGLKDALYSNESSVVKYVFDTLRDGKFPPNSNYAPNVRRAISALAHSFEAYLRYDMGVVVNNALGIEEFDIIPYPDLTKPLSRKPFTDITGLIDSHVREVRPNLLENRPEDSAV